MGLDPINPAPADIGTVHIHGSLVDVETSQVLRNPADIGTTRIHGSMWTGIRTPPKSNDPTMQPWML